MARNTGPAPVVVDLCWRRANGSCEQCHRGLLFSDRGHGWSLHHRQPRGMGGSRLTHVNQPGNLLVLCGSGVTGCHGWVESNRARAVELGLLVSRHSRVLPADVPVMLSAVQYLLDDSGGREAVDVSV